MGKRSSHQERIIRNYYKNRDAISLQRLGELVTDLYLAEGKKRNQTWNYIATALEKLEVPARQIEHLRSQDSPELVAKLVNQLMNKK